MEWRHQWSVLNPAGHCFKEWFLILGSFGSGFFSFSLVLDPPSTSSALTVPCLTHSRTDLSKCKLLSSSQMIYMLGASPWLYTSVEHLSWLRIQSKHHSKASSLRSRILTYPQSCLPPSACIDSVLWSSCSMSVNMPFPPPPVPSLPIPSCQLLLIWIFRLNIFSSVKSNWYLFHPGRISFWVFVVLDRLFLNTPGHSSCFTVIMCLLDWLRANHISC